VLEHLDRHAAVEGFGRQLQRVDVAGEHAHVAQPRARQAASMCARCVAELDTAVMRARG
jgi:hypothetical protein